MATTTATVSITSSDLIPGMPIALNASSPLMKAGLTTGLTQIRTGVIDIATGTEFRVGPLATEVSSSAHDIGSYLYLCNNSTDVTYWVDWGIHETMMGRLYAGDWMFIPWNASDDAAELEIEANTGTNSIEYAFFSSNTVLPTAAS